MKPKEKKEEEGEKISKAQMKKAVGSILMNARRGKVRPTVGPDSTASRPRVNVNAAAARFTSTLTGYRRLIWERFIAMTPYDKIIARRQCGRIVNEIIQRQNYTNVFAHFRFDNLAYEAELQMKPELEQLAVGITQGSKIHEVNPLAATFGVEAGMSLFAAQNKCAIIRFIPARFDLYNEIMGKIGAVLGKVDDFLNVTPYSVEMCLSNSESALSYEEIARDLQQKIIEVANINCRAGVGPTPIVAKLASAKSLPCGVNLVHSDAESVAVFMQQDHLVKHCNLTGKTDAVLKFLKITKLSEIWSKRIFLTYLLNVKMLRKVIGMTLGVRTDELNHIYTPVDPIPAVVAKKLTFLPMNDKAMVDEHCLQLSYLLEDELQDLNILSKTIVGCVQFMNDPQVKKKKYTFSEYTDQSRIIMVAALDIMNRILEDTPLGMIVAIELRAANFKKGEFVIGTNAELDSLLMPKPLFIPKDFQKVYRFKNRSILDLALEKKISTGETQASSMKENQFKVAMSQQIQKCIMNRKRKVKKGNVRGGLTHNQPTNETKIGSGILQRMKVAPPRGFKRFQPVWRTHTLGKYRKRRYAQFKNWKPLLYRNKSTNKNKSIKCPDKVEISCPNCSFTVEMFNPIVAESLMISHVDDCLTQTLPYLVD